MDDKKLQAPSLSLLDRYRGRDFQPLYTTTVTVSGGETGHGRASGVARSDDGNLAVDLRLPAEFGGPGNGTNPEQLFAAGFAACFHGALNLLGKRAEMAAPIRPWKCRRRSAAIRWTVALHCSSTFGCGCRASIAASRRKWSAPPSACARMQRWRGKAPSTS